VFKEVIKDAKWKVVMDKEIASIKKMIYGNWFLYQVERSQ
jgi:hypothetical protein